MKTWVLLSIKILATTTIQLHIVMDNILFLVNGFYLNYALLCIHKARVLEGWIIRVYIGAYIIINTRIVLGGVPFCIHRWVDNYRHGMLRYNADFCGPLLMLLSMCSNYQDSKTFSSASPSICSILTELPDTGTRGHRPASIRHRANGD